MDELLRLTVGGDEVIPAAGDESLGIKAEDAAGDGVAVVMVVEEPAIESSGGDGGLESGEIHRDDDNSAWAEWASAVGDVTEVWQGVTGGSREGENPLRRE